MFIGILALLLVVCSATSYTNDPFYPQFHQWMLKHEKVYVPEVVEQKFTVWKQTLEKINTNNGLLQGTQGAKFALNKFSDMTPEEFKNQYLLKNFRVTPETHRVLIAPQSDAFPHVFDWRDSNKVTPVKNQEQCGSCWAFSATENIESVWMIAKDLNGNTTMKPLSPQQIVDCDGKDGGCNGGDTPSAFKYVMKAGGLVTEADYPYRGVEEKCKFKKDKVYASITSWKYLTSQGDEETLIKNLATVSPASICIDAENWQNYDSGVMTAEQCAKVVSLDHCVQVTGYNLSDGKPYYSVRNSWGSDWGESGYIRLAYGSNTCGITDEATSAIV